MRIVHISIVLEGEIIQSENSSTKELVLCKRDEKFKWVIEGSVYPRTLAFLTELNRLAREHDGAGK